MLTNLLEHIDINQLQNLKPTIIKTSKNWVLPPRPRPGRKPNSNSPQPKSKKKCEKTEQKIQQNQSNIAISNQSTNLENPIELALNKIKDENQSLKVELSKLVSDLNFLKQQSTDIHKKRNHLEMEEIDTYKPLNNYLNDESDDDNLSQISTPSLMSNSSSLNSTNSLISIQEDQVLKIEDFLNVSYFENSGTTNIPPIDLKPLKQKNVEAEKIEFEFLKNENVFKNDHGDLFLQVGDEEVIEW